MAQDARTLEEIRRDTERARAGLTETVGELRASVTETASDLRQRISPDHIRAEVSDYMKSRGEELVETVANAIQRNPVQAVAVGAHARIGIARDQRERHLARGGERLGLAHRAFHQRPQRAIENAALLPQAPWMCPAANRDIAAGT